MKMTRIFTPEKIIKYGKTRLEGIYIPFEKVMGIALYNGTLPSELKRMSAKFPLKLLEQDNAREPIYYQQNPLDYPGRVTLHIPQFSGFGRGKRYEEMIKALVKALDKDIVFEVVDRKDDPRKAYIAYDNFAYDFVAGLFVPPPRERYLDRKIFPSGDSVKDITKVIFGPTEAVAKQAKVVERGNSEYLDSQILEIEGERVLNIGYVYADQAGIVIDKILREYEAVARSKKNPLTIDLYMFGRVGGLEDSLKRHDLVFPTGIIDDIDLREGRAFEYPMHNVLAPDNGKQLNYNVTTVIDETYEQLEGAKKQGCICVEMETRESVESVNRARRRYDRSLDINFGFVGYVSDLPLQGDTLADEMDSDKGEQEAVHEILKNI
jgi:hypothetical protein